MSMQAATMSAATLAQGQPLGPLPDPQPPASPAVDFYGPFSAVIQVLISLCRFTTVEIVRSATIRTAPYEPPSQSIDDPDAIDCYLSGPKERQGANGLSSVSEIKIYAAFDTVAIGPQIADYIDYNSEQYAIQHVKRIPSDNGTGGVWKIVAVRGD